jgi:hypothetical protein
MDEFAFTPALLQLIHASPALPIVHVPSQLCAMWKHYPYLADAATSAVSSATAASGGAAPAAQSSMGAWLQTYRAHLQTGRFLAFHWSSGHFCSLLVDLQVWRAGPAGQSSAASDSSEPRGSPSGGVAGLADVAAAAAHEDSTTMGPALKRARRASRAQREAQQDFRSNCGTPVPLLHLDTLPDGCAFLADQAAFLRELCVELNQVFGTAWPIRQRRDLSAHVHLCGPSMQTDTWSCGYRLLHAWSSVFAAMQQSHDLSPARINTICNLAEQQHDLPTMIDQALALYDSIGPDGWVSCITACHTIAAQNADASFSRDNVVACVFISLQTLACDRLIVHPDVQQPA